ncbi:MAG: hypothetical protein HYW78_04235 [Parcubacteria group bacterium]|nr:hypothetical protein [Parcubacteria group bacterium]
MLLLLILTPHQSQYSPVLYIILILAIIAYFFVLMFASKIFTRARLKEPYTHFLTVLLFYETEYDIFSKNQEKYDEEFAYAKLYRLEYFYEEMIRAISQMTNEQRKTISQNIVIDLNQKIQFLDEQREDITLFKIMNSSPHAIRQKEKNEVSI